MDLSTAQARFTALLNDTRPSDVAPLLQWIENSFDTRPSTPNDEAKITLHVIASQLRQKVPLNGLLPSEINLMSLNGDKCDASSSTTTTVHIDAFLYDDDDVEELVEQGMITRSYCKTCGSHDTAPLTFISHSLSITALKYIFTELLPYAATCTTMDDEPMLLDIGSRLGNVLYAAHLYCPQLSRIIGIEQNEEFCKLSQSVLDEFAMLDRCSVMCDDIRNRQPMLQSADVIVLHSVFECFHSPSTQRECWQMLWAEIKPGTILITLPSLIEQFAKATDDINSVQLEKWVEKIDVASVCAQFAGADEELYEDLSAICAYVVKSSVN